MAKRVRKFANAAELLNHDRSWIAHAIAYAHRVENVNVENVRLLGHLYGMTKSTPAPPVPPARALRDLRSRAGLSMEDVAHALHMKGRSSYQRYESDETRAELPLRLVRKLVPALVGRGNPPIEIDDFAQLLGKDQSAALNSLALRDEFGLTGISAERPGAHPPVINFRISGAVVLDRWLPLDDSDHAIDEYPERTVMLMAHRGYHPDQQYVLKIGDQSVSRYAPNGSYALCVKYDGSINNLRGGQLLHCERRKGDEFEITIRMMVWDRAGRPMFYNPTSEHRYAWEGYLDDPDVTLGVRGVVVSFYTQVDGLR